MGGSVATTSRRDLILRAAREEFSIRGYAGARTAGIAERAGVNKQLIHYYFGSKRGLYDAVLQSADASFGDPQQLRGTKPVDRIRRLLGSVYQSLADDPNLVGLLLRDLAESRRTRTSRMGGMVRRLIIDLGAAISEGQGLGYFRDDVDPDLAARQGVALVLGYLAFEGATSGPVHAHRAEWLERSCELIVRSLSW